MAQFVDVNALRDAFSNFQILVVKVDQVVDLLVIDFDVLDRNLVVALRLLAYLIEKLLD